MAGDRAVIGGLGLAALLALAPLEPPAPGIPAGQSLVCAAGITSYAIRHRLRARYMRLSARLFAAVWLGSAPAAALAIPVALDGFHAAKPLGRQLLSLPLAYLAAALA